MDFGQAIYVNNSHLAQPVSSFEAGAQVAAMHQKLLMQIDAQTFDSQMKLLQDQQTQRQQQAANDMSQARLAEQAREADQRNALTGTHYADEKAHWSAMERSHSSASSDLPPEGSYYDPSASSGGSSDQASLAQSGSQSARKTIADASPAELAWAQADAANPAPAGTVTDKSSSYAPGAAPAMGLTDGPPGPGGQIPPPAPTQSDLAASPPSPGNPAMPTQRPAPGEPLGGLLSAPNGQPAPTDGKDAAGRPTHTPDGIPYGKVVSAKGQTWGHTYNLEPDGNTSRQEVKWLNGQWRPTGVSHFLKTGSGKPPPPADEDPSAVPSDKVRNFGNGVGSKVFDEEGRTVVQPMTWDTKIGDWKPRGTRKVLPTISDSDSMPEAVVHDGVISMPLQLPGGKWKWDTRAVTPDLAVQTANAKANGLAVSGWTMKGNTPVATKLKLSDDSAGADDMAPAKLISKLPAADRKEVSTAFNTLLNPDQMKIKEADGTFRTEPTPKEKADIMGKPVEQMTADDWSKSRNMLIQKRADDAAKTISDRFMLLGDKNPVKRTPDEWKQWVQHSRDAVLGINRSDPSPPSGNQQSDTPTPSQSPPRSFSDDQLRNMGLTIPGEQPPAQQPPAAPAPSSAKFDYLHSLLGKSA